MPTSGNDAGKIEITYDAFGNAGPTTEMLVDVVGYTKNAGLASLQAEVAVLQAQAQQLANHGVGLNEMDATINDDELGHSTGDVS